MTIFHAVAQHMDEPRTKGEAWAVADDADEALLLLRRAFQFFEYAMPPLELAELGEGETAIRRVLGPRYPIEKAVYPIAAAHLAAG